MTKFKFSHLLLIIASVILPVIGLLWIFHNFKQAPYPNEEFYILITMYLGMILSIALIFKTKAIQQIHYYIGFRATSLKSYGFAILITFLIWGIDYLYQTKVLGINIDIQARDWFDDQTLLFAAFLTTVIFAPIIEEMLFRGILLRGVNNYLSKFWSALILSVLFAAIHFDVLQIPTLVFAALIYAWLTFKFNSIVPAIIAHIVNNGLTFVYYYQINNP